MNKAWACFFKATGWLPFVISSRPKYYYEDKSLQARKIKGSAIVMPDHHDVLDFAAMMYAFPGRNLRCLIAEVIYKKGRLMSAMLRGLGSIRVDRNTNNFSFIDEAVNVLKKGGVVEIYPEARLPVAGEETPLPFKPSVVYIALTSGAPIIPVVTNGKYGKKERLRVLIGKPIDIQQIYRDELDERENTELILNVLRTKIIDLRNELENEKKKK